MINEENKEEIIERYLENKLTGEQEHEFEAKMDADAALRREVALQKKIITNVQTIGRTQLHTQLKDIHKEMLAEQGAKRAKMISMLPHNLSYYAIAAVVTLLMAAGAIWILVFRPSDEPTLAFLPIQAIDRTGNTRGFAGGMQTVVIYPPKDSLDFHYQLADTQKLYGTFDTEEIKLFYNLNTDQYFLETHQQRYILRKTPSIMRLEE